MPSLIDIIIDATWRGGRGTRRAKQDLGGVDDSAKKTGRSTQNLTATLVGVGAALGTAALAAREAYQAIGEGAELNLARQRFDALAGSINTTGDVLLGKMREATAGMVSNAELISSASDIISTGLVGTEEDVIRLATVVSELGLDMNQIILTFANDSKLRLDALGLSITDVEERTKDYEAAGIAASEAFDLAVLDALEARLDLVGSAADSAEGQLRAMEAAWTDLQDAFKEGLAEGAEDSLAATGEGARQSSEAFTAYARAVGAEVLPAIQNLARGHLIFVDSVLPPLLPGLVRLTGHFREKAAEEERGRRITEDYAAQMREFAGVTEDVADATEDLVDVQGEQVPVLSDLVNFTGDRLREGRAAVAAVDEQRAAEERLKEEAEEAAAAQERLAQAISQITGQAISRQFGLIDQLAAAYDELGAVQDVFSDEYAEAEQEIANINARLAGSIQQLALDVVTEMEGGWNEVTAAWAVATGVMDEDTAQLRTNIQDASNLVTDIAESGLTADQAATFIGPLVEAVQDGNQDLGEIIAEIEGKFTAFSTGDPLGGLDEPTRRMVEKLEEADRAAGLVNETAAAFDSSAIEEGLTLAEDVDVALREVTDAEWAIAMDSADVSTARDEARDLGDALGNLERDIRIRVRIEMQGAGVPSTLPNEIGGLPQFQSGTDGWRRVPGSGSTAVPVLLHPGELFNVIPAGQGAGARVGGNININVSGAGDPTSTARAVVRSLEDRGLLPRTALR